MTAREEIPTHPWTGRTRSSVTGRARWLIRRLRAMGWAEIGVRSLREIRKRRLALIRRRAAGAMGAPMARRDVSAPMRRVGSRGKAAVVVADDYLAGRMELLGRVAEITAPVSWHTDYHSGITGPIAPWTRVGHRDVSTVGDVKVVWELNRHHHLVSLALASRVAGDPAYRIRLAADLESWLAQNPLFMGINWTHPLEAGIRLLCWVWTDRILQASGTPLNESGAFRESVWAQQWFIRNFVSVGTSANNHRIGELTGLLVSALAWPGLPDASENAQWALAQLEAAVEEQTFGSGFNREMAFSYQQFVLEFAAIAQIAVRLAGLDAPVLDRSVRAMAGLLRDLGQELPRFGDGDDGHVLGPPKFDDYPAFVLQLAELSTQTGDLGVADVLDVLTGDPIERGATRSSVSRDAGYVRLVSQAPRGHSAVLDLDCGPHGYLAIAAHGHADALAIQLWLNGRPILIDPGTYVYHTQPEWRSYFRGAAAHNTIVVGGLDQAPQYGAFEWGPPPRVELLEAEIAPTGGGRARGRHDAYRHQGVTHDREIQLTSEGVHVEDRLMGAADVSFAMYLHLHPDVIVEPDGAHFVLSDGRDPLIRLTLPGSVAARVIRAGEALGWYSPRFGVKVPTTTIVGEGRTGVPDLLTTQLTFLS